MGIWPERFFYQKWSSATLPTQLKGLIVRCRLKVKAIIVRPPRGVGIFVDIICVLEYMSYLCYNRWLLITN